MSYKNFDHLILLIGTNPLPNLVVADFFLKQNSGIEKIWLIHSGESPFQAPTVEQAENLEKLLKERHGNRPSLQFPLEKISVSDVSSALSIRDDIRRKVFERLKCKKCIHLNYTGGTKSMSTHAYMLLLDLRNDEADFSYLDARHFRLISDKEGVIETDLRKKVIVSFDEMVRLHGFKRKNKPHTFIFSDALKVFQNLIANEQLHKFYGEGGYNRECFLDDKGHLSESINKLSKSSRERLEKFKPNQEFMSIISAMPKECQLFDGSGKFNDQISKNNFEAAVKFLDGDWLEHHVAETLQFLGKKFNISIEQNWVIDKHGWPSNLCFEIDVVLINGYHLTGISCTTDTKKYCKNKGFEIIHRTRQIGGDEAKAVLITRMDENNKDEVQQELAVHTGGNLSNILVLGETDLKQEILAQIISKFVLNDV